jgi:hypothetical protein
MKVHSLISLAGILILSLFMIPIASATEFASGNETVLFSLTGEPFYMTCHDDRLLWLQDNSNVSPTERGIYLYNITEHSTKLLVQVPLPDNHGTYTIRSPEISGNLMTWMLNGLMVTNISAGTTQQLTNLEDLTLPVKEIKGITNPWIDGDRIVWTESDKNSYSSISPGRIVLLNLTNGLKEYVPVSMPGNQSFPRISGNYLVWNDYRRGEKNPPDLYLFNLMEKTEMRLPTTDPIEGVPTITNDQVLWTELVFGLPHIVHYNITTGVRTVIGPGSVHQGHTPQISDDLVVWPQSKNPLDFREERYAIMVFNLRTGEQRQVTAFTKDVSFPVICGDHIIYTRGSDEDIFTTPREVVLFTIDSPHVPDGENTPAGSDNAHENSTAKPVVSMTPVSRQATQTAPLTGILCIAGLFCGSALWWLRNR